MNLCFLFNFNVNLDHNRPVQTTRWWLAHPLLLRYTSQPWTAHKQLSRPVRNPSNLYKKYLVGKKAFDLLFNLVDSCLATNIPLKCGLLHCARCGHMSHGQYPIRLKKRYHVVIDLMLAESRTGPLWRKKRHQKVNKSLIWKCAAL